MANEDLKAKLAAFGVTDEAVKGKPRAELQAMLDEQHLLHGETDEHDDEPNEQDHQDTDHDELASIAEALTRNQIAAVAKIGFRGAVKGVCRIEGGPWLKTGDIIHTKPGDALALDPETFHWLKAQELVK